MTECTGDGKSTVSVCMITCDGADYVGEQVRSILHQAPLPDELVVSDDVSTDGTAEMVEELTRDAPLRVRVLRNSERLGVSANLQKAIEYSTGDIVLFADQDDIWKTGRVAHIVAALAGRPDVGLVFGDANLIDEAGHALPGSLWERLRFGSDEQAAVNTDSALGVFLRHNVVTGATVAVRRSLLESALPFPSAGWHDHWLALYAAASGIRITAIGKQLLSYRLHRANAAGLPSRSPQRWWAEQATAWRRRAAIISMLEELRSRIPSENVGVHEQLERTAAFLRHRQQLSRNPLSRARAVSQWVRTGDYDKFADGVRSISLDLLLPQRER